MTDPRFVRQQDAVNQPRLSALNITVIGLGAIGSTCALWLGKMGCARVTAYDGDTIEAQNWANQIYRCDQIGMPKAAALAEICAQFGSAPVHAIASRYTDQPLPEVVISGVDSMRSRADIWKSVRLQPAVRLYLDARMGLETLAVYAVRCGIKQDRVAYASTLCSDADALQEPCTARTICYTPLMAASVLGNLVKRYANDEAMPKRIVLDLATWYLQAD